MKHYKIPFLDFYREHNISPVAQDIADLNKHFERRNALYKHCGIVPHFINGKHVLEFGPGTGHNAVFTNAMKPDKYTLVDGNSRSISETSRILQNYFPGTSNYEVIESNIEQFKSNRLYDLVICEAVVPGQINPPEFLKSISNFVAPGGVLLITCVDCVSIQSDILRRIAAQMIIGGEKLSLSEKLDKLRPFFSKHLATLKGMSRSIDDWIIDNTLNPIVGGKFLSIEDAIHALSGEFQVYGVSPHFFTDWRWYKDIHGKDKSSNDLAIDSYRRNLHNLLDYRYVYEPIDPSRCQTLSDTCQTVLASVLHIQREGIKTEYISTLLEQLNTLYSLTLTFSNNTAVSLLEITNALKYLSSGKSFPTNLDRFSAWFGRGQQYLSFIKNTGSSV
ncbi:MAG: methyltransferase domain-containing protein [bacterium]|jgi:2-polyprenyl-3-methyl-5-hydroxy-6-metoxy-1,4-benzoquinol methylase|nr:methyltransferase domain-containing protein [bacterium]